MNKSRVNFIKVLIFNLIETLIIFLLGGIFNVDVSKRIMFMVIFFLTRMVVGSPKHYKNAYNCAIWSFLTFLSIYSLSTLDLSCVIVLTIFAGYVSTGKADIRDMFMWKGNALNEEVFEWVKYNPDNEKLLEYEKNLKATDKRKYYIFKYRFREFRTYEEIADLMDSYTSKISSDITIMSHFIEYSIRLSSD